MIDWDKFSTHFKHWCALLVALVMVDTMVEGLRLFLDNYVKDIRSYSWGIGFIISLGWFGFILSVYSYRFNVFEFFLEQQVSDPDSSSDTEKEDDDD